MEGRSGFEAITVGIVRGFAASYNGFEWWKGTIELPRCRIGGICLMLVRVLTSVNGRVEHSPRIPGRSGDNEARRTRLAGSFLSIGKAVVEFGVLGSFLSLGNDSMVAGVRGSSFSRLDAFMVC